MKVAIIGATGYGGLELIRFLHNHPEVEKMDLFTSSEEGVIFSSKYGHLLNIQDVPLQKIDYETLENYDVVFTSTPSGVTSKLLPPLVGKGPKLIDLSGDYRLKNLQDYEKWYKKDPAPQEIVDQSVYGLTEWNEKNIKDICADKSRTLTKFVPPTLDEVKEYCKERNNKVDPEKWFDFYKSKGWMIGKNKMKDWKAAVRTWEKSDNIKSTTSKTPNKGNFDQRKYDNDYFDKLYKEV